MHYTKHSDFDVTLFFIEYVCWVHMLQHNLTILLFKFKKDNDLHYQ